MTNHPNRSRSETLTAIYQSGYAIFGVGKTLSQAIADANNWLDEPIAAADLGDERTDGDMCAIKITPELAAAISERGGAIAFERRADGVFDLPASE